MEKPKETQRLRAYRAALRGVTNGECIRSWDLRLGSTYRTRFSELREEMKEKYGEPTPGWDWLPCREIGRSEEGTITYYRLVIPANARDPEDPLELLPEREKIRKALTRKEVCGDTRQPSLF